VASLESNPFGDDRRERRARVIAGMLQEDTTGEATAAGLTRMERTARRIGAWAAQSRFRCVASFIVAPLGFVATLTRPARDLAARLKQSSAVKTAWGALLIVLFVGSIVYALVTGEGSGPG
jgi:hypothetical protein